MKKYKEICRQKQKSWHLWQSTQNHSNICKWFTLAVYLLMYIHYVNLTLTKYSKCGYIILIWNPHFCVDLRYGNTFHCKGCRFQLIITHSHPSTFLWVSDAELPAYHSFSSLWWWTSACTVTGYICCLWWCYYNTSTIKTRTYTLGLTGWEGHYLGPSFTLFCICCMAWKCTEDFWKWKEIGYKTMHTTVNVHTTIKS